MKQRRRFLKWSMVDAVLMWFKTVWNLMSMSSPFFGYVAEWRPAQESCWRDAEYLLETIGFHSGMSWLSFFGLSSGQQNDKTTMLQYLFCGHYKYWGHSQLKINMFIECFPWRVYQGTHCPIKIWGLPIEKAEKQHICYCTLSHMFSNKSVKLHSSRSWLLKVGVQRYFPQRFHQIFFLPCVPFAGFSQAVACNVHGDVVDVTTSPKVQ